jgi:transcriptional regulator with XRE-family HTH domain
MLEYMRKKPFPQQELADRLVQAMDQAELSQAELARSCGVTIQAVHDWRLTGRIGKQHLVTIAKATAKPLEYFLVGLGRAAVLLLALLALALPPQVEAAPRFNITVDAIRIVRRWIFAMLNLTPFSRLKVACPL